MSIYANASKKRMLKYTMLISNTAQKQLDKLKDGKIAQSIITAIQQLADQPRPVISRESSRLVVLNLLYAKISIRHDPHSGSHPRQQVLL